MVQKKPAPDFKGKEMALFFDQEWFDLRLKICGLSRDDVAKSLRLRRDEIDEIWKDQREISTNDVSMLARLLGVSAGEVVTRAGISTPVPLPDREHADISTVMDKLEEMDGRLQQIERAIVDMQSMIIATRSIG